MAEKFRVERFVVSPSFLEWMRREQVAVAVIEPGDGGRVTITSEASDWDETTVVEVDYRGCTAVGVGGMHSEEYGQEGGVCQWCGLVGPLS